MFLALGLGGAIGVLIGHALRTFAQDVLRGGSVVHRLVGVLSVAMSIACIVAVVAALRHTCFVN